MERKLKLMAIPILFFAFAVGACGGGSGGSGSGGSDPAPTHTVTYDGNGAASGSVPSDTTNYEQGYTVTVPGNPGNLAKDHFTFGGWNTASDGSGINYAQGQQFQMGSANVTLYAKWTANPTYTVTYDGNGATGGIVPVDSTTYEETQTVTVIGNTGSLVWTHFAFAGWNTAADGSGTSYTQGATFPMGTSDVTLYAQWTANPTYTVAYDGNGAASGSVPSDTTNYEQGYTVTVPGNPGNLARDHFTFGGWNTASDGSGINYAQGQEFQMGSANVTLYAKWTANPTYTVTYDGNGATGGIVPVDSTTYEETQTVTVIGNTGNLVKNNYLFAGWNTQVDGNGTDRAPSSTFAMGSANVTLYAKWGLSPLSPDANTILLDHFDGSTSASIYGYVETTENCHQPRPTATPTYAYGPGPSGLSQALSLSPPADQPAGSASYLLYPEGELLSQSNGTLEFWVFLTSYGAGLSLVDQVPYYVACSGHEWAFGMSVSSAGQLSASAWNAFNMDSGTATVPLNAWTHVAVTWGSARAKLYINKVQVGSHPSTKMPASGNGGSVMLRLGTEAGVTTWIDELRISNIQRTW